MEHLDNRDENGNKIAEKWREFEANNPESADLVRKAVDNRELKSLEFYVSYNKALLKMGNLFPAVVRGESQESITYLRMLMYTEYQIRNT